MPFQIIRNDITKVKADAIVNTANPKPVIGDGTDRAIYSTAGEKQLLAQRKKIGVIEPGQARSTDAFQLQARYVIHTVGPAWIDGNHSEREILHDCYRNSLELADELKCGSIAFPLIATGVYGFPKDEALQIALAEISRFLLTSDMDVILVVFDRKAFELSGRLMSDISEYIDENGVHSIGREEYRGGNDRRREYLDALRVAADAERRGEGQEGMSLPAHLQAAKGMPAGKPPAAGGESLDELLENTGDTFQQRLFRLIDEKGMDDVAVYKKANIDRKLFSRIRCNKDYHPTKKTAVALAIALELDMPALQDLLSRAGIALSPSSRFDLIISYFVKEKNYNIYTIDAALFNYGQPTLSSEK